MRLGKSFTIILLMTISLLLFACTAPSSGTCDENGLCVDIELEEPIQINEPVGVTITVESKEDLSNLQVNLWFSDPDILANEESEWVVDVKAGESVQISTTIQFPPSEGSCRVHAGILHPPGRVVQDTVPVRITASGGTAYPESERTPGIPEPAEPVTPTVSPEALLPGTPALPPSAGMPIPELYAQTTSPGTVQGNWSQIVSEDFESQFPPSGSSWAVQDLSNDDYERYWDDDNYMAYAGGWAAWPANGGADGIYPTSGADNYPNDMNTRMVYGPFDLSDAVVALAQFYLWREIEPTYDYLLFEASHDGIAFEQVSRWSDDQQTWEFQPIEYNDYVGDSSVWVAWRFYSDNIVTKRGPWVDDVSLWKFVPGEVTVQGSLHYNDRDDQYTPARSMKVYLYDDDGDPGFDGSDDRLTTTVTSDQGTFQFTSQSNWDQDDTGVPLSGRNLDLYVVWETNDPASGQRVTNFDDWAYQFGSATQVDIADGTASFNYHVPEGADSEPAVWIFQDMLRGWNYIHDIPGEDPGPASARWEKDENSFFLCTVSCFWPYSPINGMFIDDQGQDSPDTVLHELGHHYMHNAIGAWWWSDIGDMLACLSHNIPDQENPLCAWAEGWATFHALAVNGDPCYDWDNLPCGGQTINLETPTWGTAGWDNGDEVEGRVTGALYDLFDNVDDGWDQVSFGFAPIWDIAGDSSPEYSFGEFWDAWRASPYDNHLAVQALFQNTINYNLPPVMVLPDRTVLDGFIYDNAINLWTYTADSDSDDWELEWEISAVSDWHCDQVSIDVLDYVDINIPYPGWLGSCDVTIRVDDGLSATEDTFTIQVVPVIDQVYLPLVTR